MSRMDEAFDRAMRRIAALQEERDELRAELDRLYGSYNGVCGERDEARAEVVRLGKEGEEHRRTIRLLQNRIQEANGITPAIAEVFGCPTCRTILNAERAGGCRDEWHHANRQAAATDRLRAALDEERIEPVEFGHVMSFDDDFPEAARRTEGETG